MKYRHFRSLRLVITGMLFLLLLNSCFDDKWDFNRISTEMEIHPGIAAPLAYGSFSVDDILSVADSAGYVGQDEDNLLFISYLEDLFSYPADEVIQIPDQQFLEFYISSDVAISEWMLSGVNDTVSFHKAKGRGFCF